MNTSNNNVLLLKDDFLLKKEDFNSHVIEYKETEPHSHSFYELVYVLNGSAKHVYNDKTSTVQTFDLFLLRPNIDTHFYKQIESCRFLHRDILVGTTLFEKICNFLSPTILDEITKHEDVICVQLNNTQLLFFEQEFSNLNYSNNQEILNSPIYIALLTQLISVFYRKLNQQSNHNLHWMDRLINILNTVEHFSTPLAELLSRHFYYNQSYMCAQFKKTTGMSMTQYFNIAKLNYAKTLMLSTDYTINEISILVGFNNISHFNHAFKKFTGVSPSTYRKQLPAVSPISKK